MNLSWSLIFTLVAVFHRPYAVSEAIDDAEKEDALGKGGKTWALLIAGTHGWSYYRHQANVCHAYKVLLETYKVPRDRIITMMYDDVANDPNNPFPGVLMNEPNGANVYEGVGKDYTGDDVNVDNMYKIITGDKKGLIGKGSGKVIEPNSQNRVFIFFTGTGKTGFSRLINDNIWADSFTKTLKDLKKKKKMKEALLFWETSHSGSMFELYLPYNSGVMAMAGAASSEDSFGWYCNINNIPVCLAGHFSINWIKDLEKKSAPKQTIFEHYNAVRAGVNSSHPNLYGSYRIGLTKLNKFFGGGSSGVDDETQEASLTEVSSPNVELKTSPNFEQANNGIAESDIPIAVLEHQIEHAGSPEERAQKQAELVFLKKNRDFMEKTMDSILEHALERPALELHDSSYFEHRRCFKKLAIQFQSLCFNNNNYYIDNILPKLYAICKAGAEVEGLKAMSTICTEQHRSLKHVV